MYVTNISELRAITTPTPGMDVLVGGYYVQNDGGGGTFLWDAESTAPGDDGTIIPRPGNPAPVGRWKRVYDGIPNIRWFGVKANDGTDQGYNFRRAIQMATSQGNGTGSLFIPAGIYVINAIEPAYISKFAATTFVFASGAKINFNVDITLGEIDAPKQNIFGGTGLITVVRNKFMFPEWFDSSEENGNITVTPSGTGLLVAKTGYNMSSGPTLAFATRGYVDAIISGDTNVHYRGVITNPGANSQGSATSYSGTIMTGDLFKITTAGIVGSWLNGLTDDHIDVGDFVIYNGTSWDLIDSTNIIVNGTIDNIDSSFDVDTSTYTVNISPNYVGQTSITTLGTITTGTWDGDIIELTKGGTGLTSVAARSILAANTENILVPVIAPDGTGDLFLKYNDTTDTIEWATAPTSNSFSTITPTGNSNGIAVVADAISDTLTIAAGNGINIDGAAGTDTLTFSFTRGGLVDVAVAGTDTIPFFDASDTNVPAFRSFSNIFADLDIPNAISANGLVTRTAADTYASRTITGTTDQITVTNGNGVAGNPTISIATPFRLGDGTVGAPAYGFTSDPDTGFYSSAANAVGFTAGGNSTFTMNASGIVFSNSGKLYQTVEDAITASGTDQASATLLTTSINGVTTVATGSADGVRLPTIVIGLTITIFNASASTLNVYPATGNSINENAINAADTIAANTSKTYYAMTSTLWRG